jgi:hypothetical protein
MGRRKISLNIGENDRVTSEKREEAKWMRTIIFHPSRNRL